MASPFHTEVDLRYTALLLPDIQNEILARFPADKREQYLNEVLSLIKLFRDDIHKRRTTPAESQEKAGGAYVGIPLIIHHVLPYGYNNNHLYHRTTNCRLGSSPSRKRASSA